MRAKRVWCGNTAFCLIGYLAGAEYDRVLPIIERAGWIIAGVVVLAILVWKVGLPWLRRRRHRQATHHHAATSEPID